MLLGVIGENDNPSAPAREAGNLDGNNLDTPTPFGGSTGVWAFWDPEASRPPPGFDPGFTNNPKLSARARISTTSLEEPARQEEYYPHTFASFVKRHDKLSSCL